MTWDCWIRTVYVQFMKIPEQSHIHITIRIDEYTSFLLKETVQNSLGKQSLAWNPFSILKRRYKQMLRAEIQTTHQLSTALELHQQKLFSLDLTAMKHLKRNLHRSISKAEFEQVCPWWLDSRRTSTVCHHLECKRRSRLELTIHPGK